LPETRTFKIELAVRKSRDKLWNKVKNILEESGNQNPVPGNSYQN
jgi:hypothetical protein